VKRISNCSLNPYGPRGTNDILVRDRIPFQGSNLKGDTGPGAYSTGYLPACFHPLVRKADYVIYSYATPIMWHCPDTGWFDPEIRYSVTTTRHQSHVRMAMVANDIRPITPSDLSDPESDAA